MTPSHDISTFATLGAPTVLVDCLSDQGITAPFPIQALTLPDSLAGRDVLGRGQTGSGKTIAFALPLVARLVASPKRTQAGHPRGLILLPTRELATQVHATLAPLAKRMGLSATTIFGGVSQAGQVRAIRQGADILVACPGRLEDLLKQHAVTLDEVEVTVLDEADHMADLGFLPGVKRIMDRTPGSGQRLLFSATLDNGVDQLVRRYLSNPVSHAIPDAEHTAPDIDHHVLTVNAADKSAVVRELAAGIGRSVLFMRTKHSARKMAQQLTHAGIPAVDLHGNLAQNARERNLAAFKSGEVRVLVATDIAARGIHIDEVELVVHVDPPAEHKAYLHRSGRTARAGASGVVVTIQTDAQQNDVRTLTRKAGISATTTRVKPGSPLLTQLVGPAAEFVTPAARPAAPAHNAGRPARDGASSSRGGRRSGARARSTASEPQSSPRQRTRPDERSTSSAPRRNGAVALSEGGSRRRSR